MPQTLEPLLRGHAFFAGLDPEYLPLIAGCAKNTVFPAGRFAFREGDPADMFLLIRDGMLALEVAAPGRGPITVQTLTVGDVAGFSWLIERHHRWQFDGRVIERIRAVELDGACLRGKCAADPELGYELMRRFAVLATDRLQATRLQLLDVYGHVG
ncbi:MAG: cyclic nucleotide-binding domain-containing protein [Streptosporangiaceae bacterium]|nr:cyclic nucleotide-binding domain-containing protein [Streptosporangiaceae bacterium]MBV9855775.1 cyclic nucleotide-binding domain-containing protein [Streptosporangiaceae bacterium]